MSFAIFSKKLGMTQIFDKDGSIIPVTILRPEECKVSQIKTVETDGYNAIQFAYTKDKVDHLTKPKIGHLKKSGGGSYKSFSEFRSNSPEDFTLGASLSVDYFKVGDNVRVTGTSIGKGFAGNQKRHNFSRGPMTHGSKNHRLPGSIGAGSTPGRVYPGKKMAGQLGGKTVTIKTCKVLFVNPEENILVVGGSVPGKTNSLLKIQATV